MNASETRARRPRNRVPRPSEDHGFKINPEDKRLRNRLSQKAFRARQIMRIKELEQRLEARPATESRITKLEDRNAFLCSQLLENHKKMTSLHFTLKALVDSSAKILEEVTNCSNMSPEEGTHTSASPLAVPMDAISMEHPLEESAASAEDAASWNSPFLHDEGATLDMTGLFQGSDREYNVEGVASEGYLPTDRPDPTISDLPGTGQGQQLFPNLRCFEGPIPSLPLSFSRSQIGPEAYAFLSRAGPLSLNGDKFQVYKTNSNFSDHILSIESFLRQQWSSTERGFSFDAESHLYRLTSSVRFMLSVMVCLSWQTMGAWHNYTKSHIPLACLTAWRVNPTPTTLAKVPACYKPTPLQLSMPHPAVIDWIPWACMRDRVILYHSTSPRLDELISDFGNYYVMEVDLSKLVAGFPPTPGYVSVWDLVRIIAPEATSDAAGGHQRGIVAEGWDSMAGDGGFDAFLEQDSCPVGEEVVDESDTSLPAPSTAALFNSKTLALKAFDMMGMGNGPHNFRLDPAFFCKYPELFEGTSVLAATGIPLRSNRSKACPVPCPLASKILSQYKELASWTVSLT